MSTERHDDTYRVSSSASSTASSFINSCIRLSLRLMFIRARRWFAATIAPAPLVPKERILKERVKTCDHMITSKVVSPSIGDRRLKSSYLCDESEGILTS